MVTYQSIVKGATKIKLAPPKEKYLTPILIGCSSQSSSSKDTQDILYLLHKRLKDSAFTICYKSLIVLHYILNECNNSNNNMLLTNVYNEFLDYKSGNGSHDYYCRASESDLLALKRYKEYLFTRISLSYNENDKKDLVDPGFLEVLKKNNSINNDSSGDSSKKIPIDEITKIIKLQIECISKLLKNKYSLHDLSNTNDLLTTCFRLLTNDLLVLYNILNEGIITILESFFELNIQLQRETCQLYDEFVDITEDVVKYLKVGKQCGLRIPIIKHITTKLGKSLREHVESPENVNNAANTSKKSSAKEQLEAIRKQRQMLESQLRITSTNLTSPVAAQATQFSSFPANLQPQATAQVPIQTGNNPFLAGNQGGYVPQQVSQPDNVFLQQQATQSNNVFVQQQAHQSTNNVFAQQQAPQMTNNVVTQQQVPQMTNNVFTQQQVPQMTNNVFTQQPVSQSNDVFAQQPQTTISTNLVQQHTTNPFFTASPNIEHNQPIQSKSLNPFSMENVQKENLKSQQTNPFSLSNQPEVANKLVNNNPFGIEKEGAVFGNVQHTGFAQQGNFQQQNYQQQANYQQQNYQNNPNQGFSLIDL